MRYGSVCSGIEAASVAWEPLGWEPAWFCEIDPFASALLAHRFPGVPNHGDFTRLLDPAHPVHASPIDVLVGGTPCQDFSVAGLRAGVEGDRGSLTLDFCRLVGVLCPKWVVWENVPGVLSSDGGRALGAFLGALGELGYGFAYRVLDAQYFGLAQRRKRVFVVGCAGAESSRAGAVLLEPESVRGDPPSRRKARKEAPADAGGRAAEPGGVVVAPPLTATNDPSRSPQSAEVTAQVAAVVEAMAVDVHTPLRARTPGQFENSTVTVVAFDTTQVTSKANRCNPRPGDPCHPLAAGARAPLVVKWPAQIAPTLNAAFGQKQGLEDQHIDGGAGWFVPVVANAIPETPDISKTVAARNDQDTASCVAHCLEAQSGHRYDPTHETFIIVPRIVQPAAPGVCFKASHFTRGKDGAPSEVAPPLSADADRGDQDTLVFTGDGVVADPISANEHKTYTHEGTTFRMHNCVGQGTVSMRESGPGYWLEDEVSGTLDANMGMSGHANRVATLQQSPAMAVRRLTPRECERLQGFPDGWTDIPHRGKPAPDSPRYKALGNSMAVPCMRWIGARIALVEAASAPCAPCAPKGWLAPSEVAPPLSADADRGDQDTLVFTGDGVVADPISANEGKTYTHEGTTFRMHNCVGQPPTLAFKAGQSEASWGGCAVTEEFSPTLQAQNNGSTAVPAVLAFKAGQSEAAGGTFVTEEFSPTLQAQNNGSTAVPAILQTSAMSVRAAEVVDIKQVQWASGGGKMENDTAQTLRSGAEHNYQFARISTQVRRLTPRCDTLQQGGISHGDAEKAGPRKALRDLREAVGEEAFTEWGLGVLASFLPQSLLQSAVHGIGVRCPTVEEFGLVHYALSCAESRSRRLLQHLRGYVREGRPSCGWEPHEQRTIELGSYLSKLSQPGTSADSILHDLWSASEGPGLLRQALSAVQEVGFSASGEAEPALLAHKVRRLAPVECEFLQGFPRNYTLIPYRKGQSSDSNRYRALGNSMAVPCMFWIGARIAQVDGAVEARDTP